MTFAQRQEKRKYRRKLHQRRIAKIMIKVGGYNSIAWHRIIDRIRRKIINRIQLAYARKEAKLSNG